MKFKNAILLSLAAVLLSGCPETPKPATANLEVDKLYKARIAKSWHEYFIKRLNEDKTLKKGWALFSYGGWADAGQVMMYQKGDKLLVDSAPMGLRVSDESKLQKKSLMVDPTTKLLKFSRLKDIDEVVFDSLNYEYVAIDKTSKSSKPNVTHIFMRAGDFSKYPEHLNLIKTIKTFEKDAR